MREIATVVYYEGPDPHSTITELMSQQFTGPVTLHLRNGRILACEWREKVRQPADPAVS